LANGRPGGRWVLKFKSSRFETSKSLSAIRGWHNASVGFARAFFEGRRELGRQARASPVEPDGLVPIPQS
jgi:hypothetical protein